MWQPWAISRRLLLGLALLSSGQTLWAGFLAGFDSAGSLYGINGQTGGLGTIGAGAGIAMSMGTSPGTILYRLGGNTYELNVVSGQSRPFVCTGCPPLGDWAFDRDGNTLFALGQLFPLGGGGAVSALFRLTLTAPGSLEATASVVGPLGTEGITLIEYVPGTGLVGTDGYGYYRINEATGQASAREPIVFVLPVMGGVTPLNGLAWDAGAGRLIGSAAAGVDGSGLFGEARLYSIVSTGLNQPWAAGWLNENPPSLTGLAAVNEVPEPGTWGLLGAGLVGLVGLTIRGAWRDRRGTGASWIQSRRGSGPSGGRRG